ncbi:MAG: GTP 3',8-cyclase MoaA [Candidatus Solibacter usitatus]|nr:GTP 3',8-cyclase MoaA [Candidatus Solibacter usitatus]
MSGAGAGHGRFHRLDHRHHRLVRALAGPGVHRDDRERGPLFAGTAGAGKTIPLRGQRKLQLQRVPVHETQHAGEAARLPGGPGTPRRNPGSGDGTGAPAARKDAGHPVTQPLLDTFGRSHNNLRISVTDRCNIRCFYCMPEHDVQFMDRHEILSFEEIERFVRVAVGLGVNKLRVTGGEPLVRKDLPHLIEMLLAVPGIRDLALTTNGVLLPALARPLYQAGLRRINVHLDTLNRDRFIQITRRDDLDRVLEGIELCRELGYGPIKINAVAVKGVTEPDVAPLARFGRERGIEVRYIEFMPLDGQQLWDRGRVLLTSDMLDTLAREICPLEEIPDGDPRAPATEYRFADGVGRVGFIASVSRPFCLNCNRIRLTADGKLRYCLFAIDETDIKTPLRNGASDEEIAGLIRANVHDKWIGHEINSVKFVPPPRPMYAIGG